MNTVEVSQKYLPVTEYSFTVVNIVLEFMSKERKHHTRDGIP